MATMTSHSLIQAAIFKKLNPGGTLDPELVNAGIKAVYDFQNVPDNKAFPYITLGGGYEISNNAFCPRGYIYFAQIDIWSCEKGVKKPDQALSRINQLLNQQDLVLTDDIFIYGMYSRATWTRDPDGLTLHVAVFYQFMIQESGT